MSGKFTPGPWEIQKYFEPYDDRHPFTNIVKDNLIVAKLGLDLCEEFVANAHLISAAPDMYEALRALITDLPSNRDWLDPVVERAAKDALKKARGES